MIWLVFACAEVVDDSVDCDSAQVSTWASFGEGFMVENCQSCHAEATPNRYGAPLAYSFDTHEDVLKWSERIYMVVLGENPTMPPGGGLTDSDKQLLMDWLVCWEGM